MKKNFEQQLALIAAAWSPNLVLLGDFNLDYYRKFDPDYSSRTLFEAFDIALGHLNLVQ